MSVTVTNWECCKALPKVELHAHLNGSCRDSTLKELAQGNQEITHDSAHLLSEKGDRTLADCFKLFDIIHKVTTSTDVITRITTEMCEDLAADNVMYAEIRTTPKNRPECNITKRLYTEAVLRGITAFQATSELPAAQSVIVRVLLSIDRRESSEAALQTVELAKELKEKGVVGIDLSGNPEVGCWEEWLPALTAARNAGLKITVHGGEVVNEREVDAMLSFAPDRFGHMCIVTEAQNQLLLKSRVPLELCLSSNVKTESVPGYKDHHLREYLAAGHPVALCTDDSGVFQTTLTDEYVHAAEAFSLQDSYSKPSVHGQNGAAGSQLVTIVEQSIDAAFVDEWVKDTLRARLQEHVSATADNQSLTGSH